MSSRSFTVETRRGRLAAEEFLPEGTADRTVLVFLHDALGSLSQWKGFPARLCAAAGCRGFAYERFGSGASDPLPAPRTPRYLHEEAETLGEVLDSVGIERPVLLGHSDGGTIALLFAARFPERPVAVVTEAAHVLVEEVTREGIRAAAKQWEAGPLRAGLERYHAGKTEALYHAWADTWLGDGYEAWDVRAELSPVRCPALAIQGTDDEYGTTEQVEGIVRNVSGRARSLLLPRVGHVPHREAERLVTEVVVEFLRDLPDF